MSDPDDARRLVEEAGELDLLGFVAGAAVAHRHLGTGTRELERDRATDPAGGTGDESPRPLERAEVRGHP